MKTKFTLKVAKSGSHLTVKPEEDEQSAIIKFMEDNPDTDISEHFDLYNGGAVYHLDKFDNESISIYCPSTEEVYEFEGDILDRFRRGKKLWLEII